MYSPFFSLGACAVRNCSNIWHWRFYFGIFKYTSSVAFFPLSTSSCHSVSAVLYIIDWCLNWDRPTQTTCRPVSRFTLYTFHWIVDIVSHAKASWEQQIKSWMFHWPLTPIFRLLKSNELCSSVKMKHYTVESELNLKHNVTIFCAKYECMIF